MKRKLLFSIVALMCMMGAWAQPTASEPTVGQNYYLYNPISGLFLNFNGDVPYVRPIGQAWTVRDGGDGTIQLQVKGNTSTCFGGKWWAWVSAGNTTNYVAETKLKPISINSTAKTYKLRASGAWGDTEAYVYINKGNEGDGSFRVACNSQDQGGLDEGYITWQFISETDYAQYIANDHTSKIGTNDFTSYPGDWTINATVGNRQAHGSTAFEYWNGSAAAGNFDYYQNLSGLPIGKYQLRAAMYNSTNGENGASFNPEGQCGVYGNSYKEAFAPVTVDGTAYNIYTTGGVYVVDGNLRVGVKNNTTMTARWFGVDWIQLTYVGDIIASHAEPLPEGNMTAGQWYYFDISVEGTYNLEATTLTDIVYTTDPTIEDGSTVTTQFSSTQPVTLSVGRYYVKSTSAQTLTVEAALYSYTVGTATKDRTYVQPGNVVTIAYPDAVTNSGEALTINTSNIQFNGAALTNATATANGFTFEIPAGLTTATDYTLSIPAGAVGYAAGATYNEAQQIALTTTALYDGVYFLKAAKATTDNSFASCDDTDAAGKYLSRGGLWGTHATLDKYGLAFQISTNGENFSVLKVYDTQRFFFNADNTTYEMWADGQGGTADNQKYVIEKHLGYLAIKPYRFRDNPYFLKVNTGEQGQDIIPVYADGPIAGPIILFTAERPSDHATAMAALKNAQAATAASAAAADNSTAYGSLDGVTSVSEMETAVSSLDNFVVVGGEAPTSVQEKYQGSQPNPAPETVYSNTLSIPAPGLYRFSMQAFYRAASNANTQAMHTAGADFPPVVLFFGDSETQIKSLYDEEGGTTPYVEGNDALYNDKYYANNMAGALLMFKDDKYHNDVWFYATEAGEYTYGVKYLGHANANMQWFIYSPEAVTVTYYGTGTITSENGIVTVLGNIELETINKALTSDIAVLNLELATGLSSAAITTTNNSNLLIYAKASSQVESSINNVIVDGTCARLRLSKKSSPFFVPTAFTASSAQYSVYENDLAGDAGDPQFATLMIPFEGSVPYAAYTLDQGVNTLGGEVKATQVSSTVPANSPVLITGSGNFTGSDVTVPVIEKDATYTSGELTGVYSTTQAPVGSYVLQNHTTSPHGVAFYLVAETQPNVGPFRAYIRPQASSAKALRVIFINGDDTTGIGTLHEDGTVTMDDAEYYTIGGARLATPQKGLNVVKYSNGTIKKIFVK